MELLKFLTQSVPLRKSWGLKASSKGVFTTISTVPSLIKLSGMVCDIDERNISILKSFEPPMKGARNAPRKI